MKLLWSMVAVVVVLALAIPPILERVAPSAGNSSPPQGFDGSTAGLSHDGEKVAENGVTPRTGTMYRWRDANGTLHIESEAPEPGVQFETIDYPTGVEPVRAEDTAMPAGTVTPARRRTGVSTLDVYTPEGFAELMDRVDETARGMRERDELLEDLAEDL